MGQRLSTLTDAERAELLRLGNDAMLVVAEVFDSPQPGPPLPWADAARANAPLSRYRPTWEEAGYSTWEAWDAAGAPGPPLPVEWVEDDREPGGDAQARWRRAWVERGGEEWVEDERSEG